MEMRSWFSGPSAGAVLDRTRGIGQGFNLLRMALSISVIFVHSFHSAYGMHERSMWLATGPLGPPVLCILILFFGLSGFLVTGSALRTSSLRTFIAFRGLRLLPALMVEVTLSALVLGPLLTTLPLGVYFHQKAFFTYFGNIVGWIHFHLPGVFETNPYPGVVNNSLWTLHPELECYGIMSVLIVTRAVKNKTIMSTLWVLVTLVMATLNLLKNRFEPSGTYGQEMLVYYFLTGIVTYHWRYWIPISGKLFAVAVLAMYLLFKLPHTSFIAVFPVMYIMVFLGLVNFPKWNLIERGDYSYGMYLYAYPVQQTLSYLFPAGREWWIIFPVTILITYGIAALSWHGVEKPFLRFKKALGGRVMQNPPPVPASTAPLGVEPERAPV